MFLPPADRSTELGAVPGEWSLLAQTPPPGLETPLFMPALKFTNETPPMALPMPTPLRFHARDPRTGEQRSVARVLFPIEAPSAGVAHAGINAREARMLLLVQALRYLALIVILWVAFELRRRSA